MKPLPVPVRVRCTSGAAGAKDWARAIAAIDASPGLYCACLHGVPGLQPRFAWAIERVALVLRVSANHIDLEPVSRAGHHLLEHPTSRALPGVGPREGSWRHPVVQWLHDFLASFEATEPFGLYGALRFEAHKLRGPWQADDHSPLGTLFLPETVLWSPDGQQVTRHHFDFVGQGWVGSPASRTSGASPDSYGRPDSQDLTQLPSPSEQLDDYPPGGHAQRIAQGLEWLSDPALVSLTLSQSFRRPWKGVPSEAFERLRSVNPAPVTFFMNLTGGEHLFGASPDLQIDVRDRQVQSFPVCGTVRLGVGPIARAEALKSLLNEQVDEASLAICSDALCNDLAPLCEAGTLQLLARREPMMLSTVVHGVDALSGRLRPDATGLDAIIATAAPAMVTGTPRTRALECIEQLEASSRAWYGGMIVRVGVAGDAQAGTILRAAWLHDGLAEVRCGGDLVAESDPQREEDETRLKAVSLWRALKLEPVLMPTAGPESARAAQVGRGNAQRQPHQHQHQQRHLPTRSYEHRLALLLSDDAFEDRLRQCLWQAWPGGAEDGSADGVGEGGGRVVHVIAGAHQSRLAELERSLSGAPLLLIGQAAVWAIARDWGRWPLSARPQNGRLARVQADPAASLPAPPRSADSGTWPSGFYVGCYGPQLIGVPDATVAAMPWSPVQSSADGEWLAAVDSKTRRVAMLYRPDSVLSEAPALESVRQAFRWLMAGARETDDKQGLMTP